MKDDNTMSDNALSAVKSICAAAVICVLSVTCNKVPAKTSDKPALTVITNRPASISIEPDYVLIGPDESMAYNGCLISVIDNNWHLVDVKPNETPRHN